MVNKIQIISALRCANRKITVRSLRLWDTKEWSGMSLQFQHTTNRFRSSLLWSVCVCVYECIGLEVGASLKNVFSGNLKWNWNLFRLRVKKKVSFSFFSCYIVSFSSRHWCVYIVCGIWLYLNQIPHSKCLSSEKQERLNLRKQSKRKSLSRFILMLLLFSFY